MSRLNVAVVGAGILGLAHTWSAAQRGHRVRLFERSSRAEGASIRNFGMVWPIGQPMGEFRDLALLSRERWLQLGAEAGLWVQPCGSIHLAHRSDEWSVLREFHELSADHGIACRLLSASEVRQQTPAANSHKLLGGLFSPIELCVNPRQAIRELARWLSDQFDVGLEFETNVRGIATGSRPSGGITLETSRGARAGFDRAIVCGGHELQTLFPDELARSGLKVCKLQMLKTRPQPGGWRIGPHLASGLTLRHYRNFEICSSLAALKHRIAAETPELDRYGIHVMASQNEAGEVILGDSHEYGAEIEPFDKTAIDDLILRELRQILSLPDWTISERWHGFYAKHSSAAVFEAQPLPEVHLCAGPGGAGMTLGLGIAESAWRKWSPAD